MTIEAFHVKTPSPLLSSLNLYIFSSNSSSFTSTAHDLITHATLSGENHTKALNILFEMDLSGNKAYENDNTRVGIDLYELIFLHN